MKGRAIRTACWAATWLAFGVVAYWREMWEALAVLMYFGGFEVAWLFARIDRAVTAMFDHHGGS